MGTSRVQSKMRFLIYPALALGLVAALGAPRAHAQTRIRLGTLAPRGSSLHQALQEMGQKWRQAPDGGVQLTIYPDGNMGTEPELVQRMRVGQLQAAMLTVTGLAQIEPDVTALQYMPMMFRSLDEVEYVRLKLEPKLEKRLLDKGFVVLFWGDAGWVRFFSRRPGLVPDDFKTMKVYVGASDNKQSDIMKAIGYQPVSLEWTDALTSLQTGMIDAVPTVPLHALAGQFYLVTRHMLEVDWLPLVGATVITKKSWESLSPAAREALGKAAAEAGRQIQAHTRQENNEAVEAMQKRGLQVHAMTPEAQAAWVKTAEEVYPRIRGDMVPADVFDEVRALVAEYRASRGKAMR